jgi:hypothetical protein
MTTRTRMKRPLSADGISFLFFERGRVSKDPEIASLRPCRCTITNRPPESVNYNMVLQKCEKDPRSKRETRSGPLGLHLATDGVTAPWPPHHRWGTRPLGAAQREKSPRSNRSSGSGCPTPIWSERGDGTSHRKPPKRSSLKTNQTTAPASAAADPVSTMEPEEAEEEGHDGANYITSLKKPRKGRCCARDFSPRLHGRPGKRSNRSTAAPPLSLATAAGQEWQSGCRTRLPRPTPTDLY